MWARGLGTCWDRFCLAAGQAGAGWEVSAVGPELGAPEPIMLSGPASADAAAGLAGPVTIGRRRLAAAAGLDARSGPAGQGRRARRACLRAHRAQAGMVPATVTAGMPSNQ